MEKYLRPGRFSTDPSSVGAEMEWIHWRTTFENFFDTIQPPHSFCKSQQDVKIRDSIKLKLFLNYVTPNVYKLFCGIETCEELITHLNNVYSRCDSNDISARYKLANKKQQAGESLYAYVQSLREIARDCNFDVVSAERNRDDYIRDVFISGIVSDDIRKKLLEKSKLTLEESVNQAADLELEFQSSNIARLPSNSQEPKNNRYCDIRIAPIQKPQISLSNGGLTKSDVVITDSLSRICQGQHDVKNLTMNVNDTKGYSPVQQKSECFFCGRLFHVRSFCPVRNVTCHICGRHKCPLMFANPNANICKSKKELRRKRAELSVALRKQARDEQLQKRRALSPSGDEDVQQAPEKLPTPQEIVEGLKSSDAAVLLKMARAARRILSREQNPPISIMIKAGVIKPLVRALDRDDCADLQFEASWALTNIASGSHEHTMAVIDSGVVPKLVSLAYAGGTVGEQCTWALGNIAGDGPQPRDMVLTSGALPAIIQTLRPGVPNSQLRTATWTFSNLCRNKNPLVNFDLVAPALPYIANLLEVEDQDVLSDSCWALSYLTDGPNERIEAVQAVPNLLKKLVRLLDHPAPLVKTPALRAVGNMLTGSDEQTDRCLDEGCLHYLSTLLRYSKPGLVKEAAWALSNILAGTQPQIQRAIDYGILPHLLHVLMHHDSRCQREAAWAITNLCLGGSPQQLDALLALGFLEPYCNLLGCQDPKTITIVLDGITNLLQAAEKHGNVEPLCVKLEMIGALDRFESLQTHENEQIYKKVLHILDVYFAEGDDETAQPSQTNEEYTFGTNQENQHMNF